MATKNQWWAKSNSDSIQSLFESQRRFDSNIARCDSSTMRFDTDSIQILTIRFKRHAIWTEIWSHGWNWILIIITHYLLLSQILFSYIWFYPSLMYTRSNSLSVIIRGRLWTARSMHVKALLRKWKFQWLPLAGAVCLDMANCSRPNVPY